MCAGAQQGPALPARTRRLVRDVKLGACHRNEPSGSLHGLMRTRAFEQNDAHVFCREDDVPGEVARFIGLLSRDYSDLGFPDYAEALCHSSELTS
jgi:threonyl-tRNA synthetase